MIRLAPPSRITIHCRRPRLLLSMISATFVRVFGMWAIRKGLRLKRYLAEQASGVHLVSAAGSFLKWVLVAKRAFRYFGSSTIVVTISQLSPFGSSRRL